MESQVKVQDPKYRPVYENTFIGIDSEVQTQVSRIVLEFKVCTSHFHLTSYDFISHKIMYESLAKNLSSQEYEKVLCERVGVSLNTRGRYLTSVRMSLSINIS